MPHCKSVQPLLEVGQWLCWSTPYRGGRGRGRGLVLGFPLAVSPQVGGGLRQEHKGPISRLLVQYLENANHGVGYQCVCVFCNVLTAESDTILDQRTSHDFKIQQQQKRENPRLGVRSDLLEWAQPFMCKLHLPTSAGSN